MADGMPVEQTRTKATLESLMADALRDSPEAARLFFTEFLKTELYVPERFQAEALKETCRYPTPFTNILGLQDKERVVAPVFSSAELMRDWAGKALTCRTFTGAALLEAVPAGWWLCLNPGQEVEKEMSPWEIDQLKAGESGIEAVLDDLFGGGHFETLELKALETSEARPLLSALIDWAGGMPEVERLYAAKEESRDELGKASSALLLGALIRDRDGVRSEEIRNAISALAARHLIGSVMQLKVFAGMVDGGLELGIFKDFAPFYSRPAGGTANTLWQALRRLIRL